MELKNKFIIKKSDGSEVNPKAKYFVLRYDKHQSNMLFMLASKKAMVTFAEVIKNDFKELSCDLIKASTGKGYIDDDIKPTLFKVATEDSPEVLEKPEKPTFYVEWKSELDKGIEHDFDKQVMLGYQDRLEAYNKAPLISQDRLELNKMRVRIKYLEAIECEYERQVEAWTNSCEAESVKLTEANKQLKDSNGHILKLIAKIATTPPKKVLKYIEGFEHIYGVTEQVDFLSKLNKD